MNWVKENKYAGIRATGKWVESKLVGMTVEDAKIFCKLEGFQYRTISIDGHGCMITADCRMDRVGLYLENGVVVRAEIG